ncbi:MAG: PAS domain S-box protein [Candidatus Omnitrophica bacterium]|nr:PAS domain S-box protein [Candidatus Omnitrophota bacterium]
MKDKARKDNNARLEKIAAEHTEKITALQKRIEFILGATKTGLDIIDKNYNLVYIDPEWQKVYGDPSGKKCYEYFMGRSTKCPKCGIRKAFATKMPVVTEEVLVREKNRVIQVTTIPYKDEKGKWLVAEINVDVTAQKKTEQALKDSENKMREITNMLPTVVYQYQFGPREEQKFTFINSAIQKIFGVSPDEVLKDFSKAWRLVLPEDAKPLFESIYKSAKTLTPWAYDFRIRRPGGKVVWIAGRSVPKGRQPDGSVIYYGTLTDVTEQKKRSIELDKYRGRLEALVKERTKKLEASQAHYRELFNLIKESEARFRAIFDNARDGMLVVDPATRRFYMANKNICRMLGYKEIELTTLSVDDIHPEEDLPGVLEKFAEQTRGNTSLIGDVPILKKNGAVFYADINASSIVLQGKQYLLGSFRDITERRKIEAALQMSEINYRSIFELASDAIMIRDIETYKTVDVNKAACEMFGFSKEDIKDLYIKHFMTDEPGYTWKDATHFYKLAADGEPQLFEWLAKDKAGRTFWVEANVKRAVIGGKYRLISMLRDVTERKRLIHMKDNFMNTVSHELRTPLAAIKEGISIVLDGLEGSVGAQNKNILTAVKKNVDRLNRLINDILDFQKLEAGKMPFRMKARNINDTVRSCRDIMAGLAHEKKLEFSLKLDETIPNVQCDADKILQVLINLTNNAVKFTKEGGITISTGLYKDAVKVSVEDTGVGIRSEDFSRMFKKFERIEPANGGSSGGTGLGLTISKEIIDKHKGKIWVESELGHGSTFSFILPLTKRGGREDAEKDTHS